ncbi:Protein phosphatase PP2A regulatory subunit B [Scheffersomyces spartinae]|uniref:aminodeoxychorismate synthase n=1 Tax=Scheffersomyces spartinae TaxID=45513 RepID=A0A9P7V6X5_9ASCO|nr:Protein phosphatase PP2A regulatory subunit B [Scheffersomyces spartinae]KAG7192035.1 Protein phosphatase PP2A regulatory subunit B [Scheffersomyces spartinae]
MGEKFTSHSSPYKDKKLFLPMILLIDSYDSFTNNLYQLIVDSTGKEVIIIHNDSFCPEEYSQFWDTYSSLFEYIIIGPGPGHPSIQGDVGIISWIFQHYQQSKLTVVPILGICLGFQCLCHEFGNPVKRLDDIKHGQIYDIQPVDDACNLFPSIELFPSVRYHSLHAELVNDSIVPLAHCYEPHDSILMAGRHSKLPLYGVQYHPESICSSRGQDLIRSFDSIAQTYNECHRKIGDNPQLLKDLKLKKAAHENTLIPNGILEDTLKKPQVIIEKLMLSHDTYNAIDICDYIYNSEGHRANFCLYNSAAVPSEWSIIGLPTPGRSEVVSHSVDDVNKVVVSTFGDNVHVDPLQCIELSNGQSVWGILGMKMKQRYISTKLINSQVSKYHQRNFPFYGGYMGLISYEEGKFIQISKLKSLTTSTTPDMKLIFIERFILFDHKSNDWFIASVSKDFHQDNLDWCKSMINQLETADLEGTLKLNKDLIPSSVSQLSNDKIHFEFPDENIYEKQFDQCQECLHSGDSYELCLTTPLKIFLPKSIDPWDIYKVLTLHKNPAPFSCFLEFDDCSLVSSSPERFISWKSTHEDNDNDIKKVELRPIKGTVKNTPDIDLNKATALLKTPKEMGENLMIVDLIRHDLYQFLPNVQVSELMSVEEYKTAFQLVSVIQGELDPSTNNYHGLDILHNSLPPGSMTGAPKKRSVELLQDIESGQTLVGNEGGRRGIYSGVCGYWSVTDDSDWSVVIRSIFHYNQDLENSKTHNLWRIGAGGALTVLSDVKGEWEEMNVKLQSACQAFH